jgi:Domain of unknown function (DUF1707)
MSDRSSLRVADADREQLVEELREHMLAGRLSSEEFEERLGRAYEARTRADVDAIRVDLPISSTALQAAVSSRHAHLRRRLVQEAGGGIGVSLVCVAIWAASGGHHGHGSFWPIWVIAATLLPVLRNGWRLFGPAPEPEAVEAHLRARQARRLSRERRHTARHRELPR